MNTMEQRLVENAQTTNETKGALTTAPAFCSALSSSLDLVSSPPQSFSSVCFLSD